jgi:hypothetical protein
MNCGNLESVAAALTETPAGRSHRAADNDQPQTAIQGHQTAVARNTTAFWPSPNSAMSRPRLSPRTSMTCAASRGTKQSARRFWVPGLRIDRPVTVWGVSRSPCPIASAWRCPPSSMTSRRHWWTATGAGVHRGTSVGGDTCSVTCRQRPDQPATRRQRTSMSDGHREHGMGGAAESGVWNGPFGAGR